MNRPRRGIQRLLAMVSGLVVVLGGCTRLPTPATGPLAEYGEYEGREIADVEFINTDPFAADTLEQLIETEATHCSLFGLPFCVPFTDWGREERFLDLGTLASDAVRLAVFYRQSGYFGTRVRPGVQARGDLVAVSFAVLSGDPILLDSLTVVGTEGILDPDSLVATLPLQPGAIFHIGEFFASADTVLSALRERGYAYAELLRNYGVDTLRDRASAELVALPGPRVIVDSIMVVGANSLGRKATLRQLEFREGDVLRANRLVSSQRNLYLVDLVQFATVEVAPDSLQAQPGDSTRATVLVTVSEGPVHVVEASAGFGKIECFRVESDWVSRSLRGGGRRLAIHGEMSKIGLGEPTHLGSVESFCNAFEGDEFGRDLDHRLAADYTQPGFLSPRNELVATIFDERLSEPGLFQREATGGRLGVVRRLRTEDVISGGVNVERGRTGAKPAFFCLALAVCQPSDILQLSGDRWRNSLNATIVRDRTDSQLNPTRGYQVRMDAGWAAPWLRSDVQFVRWTGDMARYTRVRRNWIGAGYLRLGSFFGTATVVSDPGDPDFLPPEERFFAGGPTSVRGYDRNQLGPGVWIVPQAPDSAAPVPDPEAEPVFVPVGGTSVLVGSVELRFPSPWLRRYLSMATFIDAGAVGTGELWDIGLGELRVTPGFGIRIATPVGPARLDMAYNPHRLTAGPLLVTNQETGSLFRVRDSFRPEGVSFFERLKLHVAVGHAF
ncbi:MAG: BamA/OMP85 family outer membrane protein [Longimicrobiales bacterium]